LPNNASRARPKRAVCLSRAGAAAAAVDDDDDDDGAKGRVMVQQQVDGLR